MEEPTLEKLERSDIAWIAANSNWGEKGISKALHEGVYADRSAWHRFISRATLALGTAFGLAGIFFFFAHNWDKLHRFAKLGLLEGLLVLLVLAVVLLRPKPLARKILLTAAALLVGALYAVYGQIYQTGADAYELFLLWALMILPWTLVAKFAPLWLLQIALLDLSFILYADQGGNPWLEDRLPTLLIVLNGLLLVAVESFPRFWGSKVRFPWFPRVLALYVLGVALTNLPFKIMEDPFPAYGLQLAVFILFLALGLWQGLRTKQPFYLAGIAFALVVLISALMLRLSDSGPMILAVGLFIVASIGLSITTLLNLQRKWSNP